MPEVDADDGHARAEEAGERAQHGAVAAHHDRELDAGVALLVLGHDQLDSLGRGDVHQPLQGAARSPRAGRA